MSTESILDKVKKLREITGVGFKDCKAAIEENKGDIEKSIDFLRKKGIAKANKKMERVAAEGLVCIEDQDNKISMIEINCETDFVAKNETFINFAEEISKMAKGSSEKINDILELKMKNNKNIKENLVEIISKIGEKITLRRYAFLDSNNVINFSYMHSSIKKNMGKLGVILSIETNKKKDQIQNFGKQLSMHIAASSPLALDKNDLNKQLIKKEKEIINEELKNSGKKKEITEKIAIGKINKFIADNTLLNQDWIIDSKKKVKDVLKEIAGNDKVVIKKFERFKVGEGL